ncbi:oligosaccharide flippase family protein [Weeksellaceae bacterium TAE3-ERU29]|nr:oligosaccharide flippase family protein [Weeksellaceae bacterium TAE3-ERU29]
MDTTNNKRIAKNTLFLYFRMFLTIGVGLYTSRLVLDALGVVDYGIYGLVGGIVSMFAFLNSAMAAATQRYLSFDIGKNNINRLSQTFNATLNIHFLVAFVIFILSETIGLWFVNYKLDIPSERITAANWVYQLSIFTFILNVIQVPYNALLIARERMNIYAYISIVETLLKLIAVILLIQIHTDKLILYAFLIFFISLIVQFFYKFYCKKHYKETIYHFFFDKIYYKELLSYSGWNLFGNIAAVARGQGSNILLNLFFGPVANAAYSLTLMVQGMIGNFITNFQMAVNPQIVKKYSKGEVDESLNLIFKSAKFSFFGMLILIIPFLSNIDFVMGLWLTKIPKHAIGFIKLALIYSLIETIANPLMSGAQATGKIKWYQIIIGTLIFLSLPTTWIVFRFTNTPMYVYWVLIVNSLLALIFRLFFLKKIMDLDLNTFLSQVIIRILFVSLFVTGIVLFLPLQKANNIIELIFQSTLYTFLTISSIIILGLSKNEKFLIKTFLKSKFIRK